MASFVGVLLAPCSVAPKALETPSIPVAIVFARFFAHIAVEYFNLQGRKSLWIQPSLTETFSLQGQKYKQLTFQFTRLLLQLLLGDLGSKAPAVEHLVQGCCVAPQKVMVYGRAPFIIFLFTSSPTASWRFLDPRLALTKPGSDSNAIFPTASKPHPVDRLGSPKFPLCD